MYVNVTVCGNESFDTKEPIFDAAFRGVRPQSKPERIVLQQGFNDGSYKLDLRAANDAVGYQPLFKVKTTTPMCGIKRYEIPDCKRNPRLCGQVAIVAENFLQIQTAEPYSTTLGVVALLAGRRASPTKKITFGVCRADFLQLPDVTEIGRTFERGATNEKLGPVQLTTAPKYVFDQREWRPRFVLDRCSACEPEFAVVGANREELANAAVRFEANRWGGKDLVVDTGRGLDFTGYIKAYYEPTDSCHAVSPKPQFLRLRLQICGSETVSLTEGGARRYKLAMAIDPTKVISSAAVAKLFRASSDVCGITKYDVVRKARSGDYVTLPALARKLFRLNPRGDFEIRNGVRGRRTRKYAVYLKATTRGGVSAYKSFVVDYVVNSGPTFKKLGNKVISVDANKPLGRKTVQFKIKATDKDGDAIARITVRPARLLKKPWLKVKTDAKSGTVTIAIDRTKIKAGDAGKYRLKLEARDEFWNKKTR